MGGSTSTYTKVAGVILPALMVLSGCIGGSDKKDPGATGPNETDIETGSAFGAIRGVVQDDESRPLVGAEVGVRNTGLIQRTDGSGGFRFNEVEPGQHTIDVAKLGYGPSAREAEVVAGQIADITFTLQAIVIPEASYPEVSHFTGYYDCALGAVIWVSACTYPYTAVYLTLQDAGYNMSENGVPQDLQTNTFRYNFTVKPGAVEVVSELEWVPSSAAATRMQLLLSCAQYDPVLDDCPDHYGDAEGESPLRVAWPIEGNVDTLPDWVMARAYLPFFDPQVALAQQFDFWNTIWYYGASPEGYTAIEE